VLYITMNIWSRHSNQSRTQHTQSDSEVRDVDAEVSSMTHAILKLRYAEWLTFR
jgi:hypothetical protein